MTGLGHQGYDNMHKAKRSVKRQYLKFPLFILLSFLTLTACSTIGPEKLVSSHEGYNDAVQLTMTREVLKNIVRARYSDPMQFIMVSAINAQFSVNAGVNAGTSGIGTQGAAGQAGGNIGYSESPTITYIPQSDSGFNKSLDAPINLQEALSLVFLWGHMQSHEVGLVAGAVNDASDRKGPMGGHYRALIDSLVSLFEHGATLKHFREFYPRHIPIAMSEITGRAYVDAAKADLYFYDAGDGKVDIASKHMGIGLFVPFPHEGRIKEDLRLLGIAPGERLYPIRTPGESEPEQFVIQSNTIWIAPRSVESMIELAAMRVEVPPEHQLSGIAPVKGPAANSGVVLKMRILNSMDQPSSIYRIQHRGYWFYIDDTDTASKRLFSTIVQSYTSRIGSKPPTSEVPQIVQPLGGG